MDLRYKRVRNEMKFHSEIVDYTNSYTSIYHTTSKLHVEFVTHSSFKYTRMKIPAHYPFHPPILYFKGMEWTSFLKNKTYNYDQWLCMIIKYPESKSDIQSYIADSCLCCQSKTCRLNWNVNLKIINIYDEFKYFIYLVRMKKSCKIINTFFEKFPQDVVYLIVNAL